MSKEYMIRTMSGTKRHLVAVAACCYSFGQCAQAIGYEEPSTSLISRNLAIITLKTHNFAATTRNVNAYLAGVASTLIRE